MDQTNTTNRERRQERKEYDRTYGCMEIEDGLGLRMMKNLKKCDYGWVRQMKGMQMVPSVLVGLRY